MSRWMPCPVDHTADRMAPAPRGNSCARPHMCKYLQEELAALKASLGDAIVEVKPNVKVGRQPAYRTAPC
jgi:hypothetical protein